MTSNTIWKYCLLGLGMVLTSLSYGSPTAPQNNSEQRKWQAMVPNIRAALESQASSCQPGTVRADVLGAADFLGASFALIDVCPLGAYTELIDAMRLDANQPVLARFRKGGHRIAVGFSRGASVMHGKDVKLVPEEHAIYDISWDNDGTDSAGMVRLRKCVADAYVWHPKTEMFDHNARLTTQATQSYCRELKHRAH
jgi:hypothetical protein